MEPGALGTEAALNNRLNALSAIRAEPLPIMRANEQPSANQLKGRKADNSLFNFSGTGFHLEPLLAYVDG
ncbi:hypothetical protein, partial [Staphylococcus aureus]|uniref:hypothetical protein n=1 Tax=Staphylococcus aureus TaxID=1280 RepID=UPI001B31B8D7